MAAAPVKYQGFTPALDPSFWQELMRKQLDEWQLSAPQTHVLNCQLLENPPKAAFSYNSFSGGSSSSSSSTATAGAGEGGSTKGSCSVTGLFKNLTTIEEFRRYDRKDILAQVRKDLWDQLRGADGKEFGAFSQPFLLVCFGDLKKYDFFYTLGFPGINVQGGAQVRRGLFDLDS